VEKQELLEGTKRFTLPVLKLVDRMPATMAGRALGNQLVRSGTAIGANYRAACRARSRAEFAAKLGIVAEEVDESLYWLELIRDGKLFSGDRIADLLKEADELTAIFTAGRRTSISHQTSNIKGQTFKT
jgi:four helix bundle protein